MATNQPNPDFELPNDFIEPEVIQRFRQRFRTATANQVRQYSKEALTWFRIQVSKNFNPKANQIIAAQSSFKKFAPETNTSMIGRLYLFDYDAETAGDEETGTFDKYPMIFIFRAFRNNEGKACISALNVHYLSAAERQILFEELMKTRSSKTSTARAKLNINWKIIKAVCKSELYSRAVHTYRMDRIQSQLVEIPHLSWPIAVFLRLEKFVQPKTHEQTVLPSTMRRNITKRAQVHRKR